MVIISVFIFYVRRVIINYRTSLELFQIFLKDFKETPRTKMAKKYLKDDPILEDDTESDTTSINSVSRGTRGLSKNMLST
jgi:hypothetical protein